MNKLFVDLDDTLAFRPNGEHYKEAIPDFELIDKLTKWREAGFEIVIFTARNMRTYDGNLELITKYTLPDILEWLRLHNVPYDDVIVGKPWPGPEGYYIDDRALTPEIFMSMPIPKGTL
jgi:capsule biosynthesis phosphatase